MATSRYWYLRRLGHWSHAIGICWNSWRLRVSFPLPMIFRDSCPSTVGAPSRASLLLLLGWAWRDVWLWVFVALGGSWGRGLLRSPGYFSTYPWTSREHSCSLTPSLLSTVCDTLIFMLTHSLTQDFCIFVFLVVQVQLMVNHCGFLLALCPHFIYFFAIFSPFFIFLFCLFHAVNSGFATIHIHLHGPYHK